MKTRDVMNNIVADLIAEIERGADTWTMPWNTTHALPANAITGTAYRGGNIIALWLAAIHHHYTTNQWATYKQWNTIGAHVRKGQHGTRLIRWVQPTTPDTNQPTPDDNQQRRLLPVAFTVFNADQCDTTNTEPARVEPRFDGNFAHFFDNIPARIAWGTGNPAYRPNDDTIVMPDWDAFHTTAAGMATLAHELAHWTGHPRRLNRNLTGRFGDDAYAIEELTAELSAAFTCAEVGITPAIRTDHAPYLNHWLRILQAEPSSLWTVARHAQAATDHLASYSTRTEHAA